MSTEVLAIVLFAALLHALWNAAVKASVRQALPSTAVFIGAGIVAAFVVPFLPVPALASWPFLLGSVAVHCAYSILLGRAADRLARRAPGSRRRAGAVAAARQTLGMAPAHWRADLPRALAG